MQDPGSHRTRKQILVDPTLQLSVAWAVIGTFLALSALFVVAYFFFAPGGASIDEPSSQAATRLGIVVTGTYFVLVLIAVILVAIHTTQRIAGPARVIEDALRGILEDDYDRRLSLRQKDHLASLAQVVLDVRTMVRDERDRKRAFHEALEDALSQAQYERARALNHEHSGGAVAARDERNAA